MKMNGDKLVKVAVLLVSFFTFLATSPWVSIKGKVVEVEGSRIKITYESNLAPTEGDKVELADEIPGAGVIPVEGTWKIVEVSRDFAWAEAEGGAGTPAPDYLAIILSPHPRKRSDLVAKDEQPRTKQRKKGWLGLHIKELNPELRRSFDIPPTRKGVFVNKVRKGSPADIAGIKLADLIIEFNGQQVASLLEVKELVVTLAPGAKVEIVFIREGERKVAVVKLGERPKD